jgi:hypothetical protein
VDHLGLQSRMLDDGDAGGGSPEIGTGGHTPSGPSASQAASQRPTQDVSVRHHRRATRLISPAASPHSPSGKPQDREGSTGRA